MTQYLDSMFQDLSDAVKAELGITPILDIDLVTTLASGSYPIVAVGGGHLHYVGNLGLTQYNTVDADGNTYTHDIDYRETMLVQPSFQIVGLAAEISQIVDIENLITKMYSEPRHLFAEHPNMPGVKLPFQISLDSDKEIERSTLDIKPRLYTSSIWLTASTCVSFYKPSHPAELAFDEKLRGDMLDRIDTIGLRWKRLGFALKWLEGYYQHADLQDKAFRDQIQANKKNLQLHYLWVQMEKYPQLDAQALSAQIAADRKELWKIRSELLEQTQILPKEFWGEDKLQFVDSVVQIQQTEGVTLDEALQKAIKEEEEHQVYWVADDE